MASFWRKAAGTAVIVGGTNLPIWCDVCPCTQDFGGCTDVPLALVAHITEVLFCSDFSTEVDVPLTWVSANSRYEGSASYPGGTVNVYLRDDAGTVKISLGCNTTPVGETGRNSETCNPYVATFTGVAPPSCCGVGSVDVSVEES